MFNRDTIAAVGIDRKEFVDGPPDAAAFLCVFLELAVSVFNRRNS